MNPVLIFEIPIHRQLVSEDAVREIIPDAMDLFVGDAGFASLRITALAVIPSLDVTGEVDELAARLLAGGLIPARAAQDAFHVAVSAVHGMDFLLTWNCTHINNVNTTRRMERICAEAGFACPVICSPDELLPPSSI